MNTSLLKSAYLPLSIAIVVAFVVWFVVDKDIAPGQGHGGDVTYLLWTGWVAVALYVAIIAYVARKYVHRIKRPPSAEKLRPIQEQLDRASALLKQAEREILSGVLSERKDIEDRVRFILRQEGVSKILRVRVEPGPPEGPAFVFENEPTEPAGRVIVWLHAHLYLGIAAAVIVLLHGGAVFDTPMGILLNVSSLIVTASGIIGVYYWAVGPSRLTKIEEQLSVEQAYSLDQHFTLKLREALAEPKKDPEKEPDKNYEKNKPIFDALVQLKPAFAKWRGVPSGNEAEAALKRVQSEDKKLAALQRDLVVLFCQREKVRRELRRLSRVRFLMNFWRIVHVPASIVLVGVLIVHVFTVWWY